MASSRFDNIKYFDGSTFKTPTQVKVYGDDGWVDLGAKDSDNKKKLVVYDGSSFDCVTYEKRMVDIPGYATFGSGNKFAYIKKNDGSNAQVDNWKPGYKMEMVVEVYSSCTLYLARSTNQGDITYGYVSYRADVSGNTVRFRSYSRFRGYGSDVGGAFVDSSANEATGYVWTKGEKVRIVLYKSTQNGKLNVKVYNMAGTQLCNNDLKELNIQVWTPGYNRVGAGLSSNGSIVCEGEFKLYSFKYTPIQDRSNEMVFNFNTPASGSTRVNSSSYGGYLELNNTSTYKANYAEWDRQTI